MNLADAEPSDADDDNGTSFLRLLTQTRTFGEVVVSTLGRDEDTILESTSTPGGAGRAGKDEMMMMMMMMMMVIRMMMMMMTMTMTITTTTTTMMMIDDDPDCRCYPQSLPHGSSWAGRRDRVPPAPRAPTTAAGDR
jgi:hypothetical protein